MCRKLLSEIVFVDFQRLNKLATAGRYMETCVFLGSVHEPLSRFGKSVVLKNTILGFVSCENSWRTYLIEFGKKQVRDFCLIFVMDDMYIEDFPLTKSLMICQALFLMGFAYRKFFKFFDIIMQVNFIGMVAVEWLIGRIDNEFGCRMVEIKFLSKNMYLDCATINGSILKFFGKVKNYNSNLLVQKVYMEA